MNPSSVKIYVKTTLVKAIEVTEQGKGGAEYTINSSDAILFGCARIHERAHALRVGLFERTTIILRGRT